MAMAAPSPLVVAYWDPGNVWQFLQEHMEAAVPLKSLQLRIPNSGAEVTVASIAVQFAAYDRDTLRCNSGAPSDWLRAPFCHIYFLVCETLEAYRSTELRNVGRWIEEITSKGGEWMVMHAAIGKNKGNESADVFKRLVADLDATERCCRVSVFDVSSGDPAPQFNLAFQKVGRVAASAFSRLAERLEGRLREVEATRFTDAFLAKDALVVIYMRMGLASHCLPLLEAMDRLAIQAFPSRSFTPEVLEDLHDKEGALGPWLLQLGPSHRRLDGGTAHWFHLSQHLFARRAQVCDALGRHAEHLRAALGFVKFCVSGMMTEDTAEAFAAAWGIAAISHVLRASPAAQNLAAEEAARSPLGSQSPSSLSPSRQSSVDPSPRGGSFDTVDTMASYRALCALYEAAKSLLVRHLRPDACESNGRLPFQEDGVNKLDRWKPLADDVAPTEGGLTAAARLSRTLPACLSLRSPSDPDDAEIFVPGETLGLSLPAGHKLYDLGSLEDIQTFKIDLAAYREIYTDLLNIANVYYTAAARPHAAAVVQCEAGELLMADGHVRKAAALLRRLTRHFKRSGWSRISAWGFVRYGMCCLALQWWAEYATAVLELLEPSVRVFLDDDVAEAFFASIRPAQSLLPGPLLRRTEKLFQFEFRFPNGVPEKGGVAFEAGEAVHCVLAIHSEVPHEVPLEEAVLVLTAPPDLQAPSPEPPALRLATRRPLRLEPGRNVLPLSSPAGEFLPRAAFSLAQLTLQWGRISFILERGAYGLDQSFREDVGVEGGQLPPVVGIRTPTCVPHATLLHPPCVPKGEGFRVGIAIQHEDIARLSNAVATHEAVGVVVQVEVTDRYALSLPVDSFSGDTRRLLPAPPLGGRPLSEVQYEFWVPIEASVKEARDVKHLLGVRVHPKGPAPWSCFVRVKAFYAKAAEAGGMGESIYAAEVFADVSARVHLQPPFSTLLQTRLLHTGEPRSPHLVAQWHVCPTSFPPPSLTLSPYSGPGWASSHPRPPPEEDEAKRPSAGLRVLAWSFDLPPHWGWTSRPLLTREVTNERVGIGECVSRAFLGSGGASKGTAGSAKLRLAYAHETVLERVQQIFEGADVSMAKYWWELVHEESVVLGFHLGRGVSVTYEVCTLPAEALPPTAAPAPDLGFRCVVFAFDVVVTEAGTAPDTKEDEAASRLLYRIETHDCWMVHNKQRAELPPRDGDGRCRVQCEAVPFKMGSLPIPALKIWRQSANGIEACQVFPPAAPAEAAAQFHGTASFDLVLPPPQM